MTLGEKIYELRTKQGLSQGDLAEQLNVSRQSISKWETNSSTPDLDKLIKMSQLFQVTLDELVLDKRPDTVKSDDRIDSRFPTQKIAGTILLCMGFLTFILALLLNGSWPSLILAVPFLLCGIICFASKRYAGLWCAWGMLCFWDIYSLRATSISWQTGIRSLLYPSYYTKHSIPTLVVSWILLLYLIALITVTVLRLSKAEAPYSAAKLILHVVGWTLYLFLAVLTYFISARPDVFLLFPPFSWARITLLIMLLIFSIRFWRYARNESYHE